MDIFKMLNDKFNLKEKIKNLSKLFLEKKYFDCYDNYVTFDDFFDRFYFRKWKYSYGCYNLQEFKDKLGLANSIDYYEDDKYFYAKNEISAINFLQYAYNATKFVLNSMNEEKIRINKDIHEFYNIFNNNSTIFYQK